MDSIWIEGGKRLEGTINIPASKNAALPLLCLSLLTNKPMRFKNIPQVADIFSLEKILHELGAEKTSADTFHCQKIKSTKAHYDWVRKMRASVLLLGPILAREGYAEVSLPGGCAIGQRPIDIHIDGLKAMGATIELEQGYVVARAKKLKGAHFVMHFPTVTGTINLMTAAVLADGETVFENCAMEPEVVEVSEALIAMGAKIEGHGTPIIKIQGVTELNGIDWEIQPDRIQLLTYLAAAAITGGQVTCAPYRRGAISAVVQKFREMGSEVREEDSQITLLRTKELQPLQIETAPFPGFPTDAQAQFMACLTTAAGSSTIQENIFESRFQHVSELQRLGAEIELKGNTAFIKGVKELSGTTVMASDLRASASLILAGLIAKGKTQILRVYHLDRGYEGIEQRLSHLGARIWRAPQ